MRLSRARKPLRTLFLVRSGQSTDGPSIEVMNSAFCLPDDVLHALIRRFVAQLRAPPRGGANGGQIVAQGTPEQVAASKQSYTGSYLTPMLKKKPAKASAKKSEKAPA